MSKILITGAAGFIGSNFTKYLCKNFPNSEIFCTDSLDKPLSNKKTTGLGSLANLSPLGINFKLIDVYGFTAGDDDFSNGLYHIDGYHLGSDALPKIAKQLGDFLSKM